MWARAAVQRAEISLEGAWAPYPLVRGLGEAQRLRVGGWTCFFEEAEGHEVGGPRAMSSGGWMVAVGDLEVDEREGPHRRLKR